MKYIDKVLSPSWYRLGMAKKKTHIVIGATGVLKSLKNYVPKTALVEYIWNGFDAGATNITVDFLVNEAGRVKKITITDNGRGISNEEEPHKFLPFFETAKEQEIEDYRHQSLPHGRIGVGRLTFYRFARLAKWTTVFQSKNGGNLEYQIEITSDALEVFSQEEIDPKKTTKPCGTVVEFTNLQSVFDGKDEREEVVTHIKKEFAWFLELNRLNNLAISINGQKLTYEDMIEDQDKDKWSVDNRPFAIHYFRWKEQLNDEMSKIYYLDSTGREVYKEYTGLNRQGDGFNHSVFVSSDYFKDFHFELKDEYQRPITGVSRSDPTFKKLEEKINRYLRKKRRPFLKRASKALIEKYEIDGIIEKKAENEFLNLKNDFLKSAIEELYQVQPKIFARLNSDQQKTFVGFLQLLLDTDERDRILDIVDEIEKLQPEEREELRKLLDEKTLLSITRTMNLLVNRRKQIAALKELVFNESLSVKEEHIQEMVEDMTWLFGEEYNLLAAMEDDFEKALRNLWKEHYQIDKKMTIADPDKRKQVDVFLYRRHFQNEEAHNVIIELKAPSIKLGNDEYNQIIGYANLIINEDQFNADTFTWDFILVGNEIDKKSVIPGNISSMRQVHGEKGLVFMSPEMRTKVVVRKWSEIFTDFEMRTNFLYERLQDREKKVVSEMKNKTPIEIVEFGLAPT